MIDTPLFSAPCKGNVDYGVKNPRKMAAWIFFRPVRFSQDNFYFKAVPIGKIFTMQIMNAPDNAQFILVLAPPSNYIEYKFFFIIRKLS
jgi:hypothetical protein